MKNKNTIFNRKHLIFGLAVLVSTVLVTCKNPIMEKWWPEPAEPRSNPVGLAQDADDSGGSGENFGVVRFNLDFEPNVNLNEGPQPKNLNILWGAAVGRLRPIARSGYGFVGWVDENGDEWNVETRPVTQEDDVNGDGYITLKAIWSRTTFKVTFVTNSAAAISDQIVGAGGKIIRPVNPQRNDGYGFAGWYEDPAFSGQQWDFINTIVTYNTTLYANWDNNTRPVIFEANGGKRPDGTEMSRNVLAIPVNGYIQDPGPLVKEGYSFGGWYTDIACTDDKWNFYTNTVAAGDDPLYIYAKWEINIYFVKFVTKPSVSAIADQSVAHGGKIIQPSGPSQLGDGRVVAGWYIVDGTTNTEGWHSKFLWNFAAGLVTGNMTLYARWGSQPDLPPPPPPDPGPGGSGENFGHVVFDTDGGVPQPKAIMIAWGGTVGRLRPITKTGYSFIGWFDEDKPEKSWDVETREVKKEDDIDGDGFITLTARWSTIIYTVNFVTAPSAAVVDPQKAAPGGKITQPALPAPPDGFGFAGWYTDVNYTGSTWDFAKDTVSGDMTLYAKWEIDTRAVHFEVNGGTRPDGVTELTHTQIISLSYGKIQDPGPLVKNGFSFAGWYTDSAFGGKPWNFADDTVPGPAGVDFWLYAKWDVNTYIVKFVTAPSSAIIADQNIIHGGKAIRPADPSAAGKEFFDWYADANFSGEPWDFENNPVTKTMTLYARWLNIYTVNFRPYPPANVIVPPADPIIIPPQSVKQGEKAAEPARPPQLGDGRSFDGWYTEDTYLNKWNFANNAVTGNMTLYARYVPQTRTVHFQVNGGLLPSGLEMRTSVTIPIASGIIMFPGTLVRTGYTFTGWYTDPACTIPWNFSTDRVTVPDVIIGMDYMYLHAGWTPMIYAVTFNANSGLPAPESQSIAYGERVRKPPIMSKTEMAFDGWFTDPGFAPSSEWNFDDMAVTGNLTLHAKWVAAAYTVKFYSGSPNGAPPHPVYITSGNWPAEQLVKSGGTVTEPFMPSLPAGDTSSWSFLRWDHAPGYDGEPNAIDRTTANIHNLEPWNFNTGVIAGHTVEVDGVNVLNLYARWVPPVPDMVWVPRGSFTMGDSSISGSPAAYHSYPTRRVTVDGFYISRFEITQIDGPPLVQRTTGFVDVMGSNPSQFTGTTTRPAERVTWFEAVNYCNTRTTKEGPALTPAYIVSGTNVTANLKANGYWNNGYRLPTEAEWEYAARGGNESPDNFTYAGGEDPELLAWYNITIAQQPLGMRTTQTAGTKAPNALGIYDMSGNVSEWCWDWFASYKNIIDAHPAQEAYINPKGPSGGTERVRRGGAWNNGKDNIRNVVRNSDTPETGVWNVGFRAVRGPADIW